MALFLSTIINRMDSKYKVSVPSTFRNSLKNQSFKGIMYAFPLIMIGQLTPVEYKGWKIYLIA